VRRFTLPAALVAVVVTLLALPATAFGSALFLIKGGGWGNGVGMSQWGAEGYARHGWGYERILSHYYSHTTLSSFASQDVRVLLAEAQDELAVGSGAPFALVDARGRRVHVRARTLHFSAQLKLGKRKLVPPITVEPGAQPLQLNGAAYRGSLVLAADGGKLDAINVVPLERYLRGVVPSEMPWHWHMQAYEAQAVAARTYALYCLNPGAAFDLYGDARSQVYGGIAAEKAETNLAVGATTGRVVTYGGRVIAAYYGANSGGRTAAVEDVMPRDPAPYLVSVRDPFDAIAPYHQWSATARTDTLSDKFGLPVSDVRLEHNGSGRVSRVVLSGRKGSKSITGQEFMSTLGLRSTFFKIHVVALAEPPPRVFFSQRIWLHGFVRGIGGVVLQEKLPTGAWRQVGRVHARVDGRFQAVVRPQFSTSYRLAVDRVPGPVISVQVARTIAVHAEGKLLAGQVLPAAPIRIERKWRGGWKPVTQGIKVTASGAFRFQLHHAGSYRVSSEGSGRFLASASRAVSVRSGARAAGTSAPRAGSPARGTRASRRP
jgi:stage II sporulation protein D